eukprot:scaffold84219_cov34-Tisochrysis_lutea.AAC.4
MAQSAEAGDISAQAIAPREACRGDLGDGVAASDANSQAFAFARSSSGAPHEIVFSLSLLVFWWLFIVPGKRRLLFIQQWHRFPVLHKRPHHPQRDTGLAKRVEGTSALVGSRNVSYSRSAPPGVWGLLLHTILSLAG